MILKKTIYLNILLLLLALAASNDAAAQFWRRGGRSNKVNTSNKYPLKSKTNAVAKVEKKSQEKKSRNIHYPESIKRERYRIDILIPLYLDEMVKEGRMTTKGRLPEKVQSGLNFYEGVQLAVDTLKYMGYQTDIYIHDIGAKGNNLQQLIQKDSLDKTDLIIGFVSSQQVAVLAEYAMKNKVNFVSAFSPSDANVKNNPYFILMNPTLQNNCEAIVKRVLKKRKKEQVFLYSRTHTMLDSTAYGFIKEAEDWSSAAEIDCNKMPDSASLAALFDPEATNIIVMPIMDNNYAERLINQLSKSFADYQFEIYGMPTWKNITSTKNMLSLGEHIVVYTTQPYYFDATVSAGQVLANKYKNAFAGKPSELTFRGFELVYWMTDLLNKYGAIFNEKTEDNGMAVFTRYEIKPKWDAANNLYYLENKHLYLYRFQAGNMLVEQ